jgi:hypothetical protein
VSTPRSARFNRRSAAGRIINPLERSYGLATALSSLSSSSSSLLLLLLLLLPLLPLLLLPDDNDASNGGTGGDRASARRDTNDLLE